MTLAQLLNHAARSENAAVKSFSNLCHYAFFGAILLKPAHARFSLRKCFNLKLFPANRA